jgi:2,3,4,5-tetrahydropyridine-2-carboxylate N-succinyltransferase
VISAGAEGIGLATITPDGTVLDTWFLALQLIEGSIETGTNRISPEQCEKLLGPMAVRCLGFDERRGVDVVCVRTRISSLEKPPLDAHDIYLRLHLLSHRIIHPRDANLERIFQLLSNVAWTSLGPCPIDKLDSLKMRLRAEGRSLDITSIDKIPHMTDYVVPCGVRIADANRVRLGAYLSSGTSVLQEGFCNFNAGTLGAVMVEGRISAGVIVHDGTDIGGGASIMGTQSGGGKHVVSIGRGCLLGANSGLGISLGDDCVVEAGLYVTAGTRVTLEGGQVVKALELSGRSRMLFRRNSQTGIVEALAKNSSWGKPFTGM